MSTDLADLLARVRAATGSDRDLDAAIADRLDQGGRGADVPPYTSSVDACLDLVDRVLPGWHWHVGYGPQGVVPYAALANGPARHEASAPTVPLALLSALLAAKLAG